MIIVRLKGRLGNQMFEYATSYALSRKYNEKLVIYKYEYDTARKKEGFTLNSLKLAKRNFYCGVPLSLYYYTTKNTLRIKFCTLLGHEAKDPEEYHDKKVETIYEGNTKSGTFKPLTLDKNYSKHVIDGFRQSPLYFDEYYDEITAQFQPDYQLDDECLNWQSVIENDDCSVSIHIRRGDYVQINWTIPTEYYYAAMQMMKEKYPNATFYVFSDDVAWAKENLQNTQYQINYIEHHLENKPFDDIWLMSKCKHNIIANSSYSWWGAYLNRNKNKTVIAPQKITKTNSKFILPDDWIII